MINATGVWAGELDDGIALRPSRGTHLVFAPSAFGGTLRAQVSIPLEGQFGRFLLALPRPDGSVILGLTDEPIDGPIPDVPEPSAAEIAFLLEHGSRAFRLALDADQVIGAYAGLRPLVAGGADATADLSRSHVVRQATSGVVTVTGGKLTTYRQMAEDAVDAAVAASGLPARPCRTTELPLIGAASRATLASVDAPRRLVERHGTEAAAIARIAAADRALAAPVVPGSDVLTAELVWAIRHEGARTVGDLLDRRTRIGLNVRQRAAAVPVAEQALDRSGVLAASGR